MNREQYKEQAKKILMRILFLTGKAQDQGLTAVEKIEYEDLMKKNSELSKEFLRTHMYKQIPG